MKYKLLHGDCLNKMAEMDDNSVHAIVTDPPYGLAFMGKKWDYQVPSVAIWREALRVLKPGGFLISFAGSRTYHRMAVNIEDAGFEIRDQIMWVYGSGFPKSHNISKAIDKAAGVEPIATVEASGVGFMNKAKEGHTGGRAYKRSDGQMNETKNRIIMPKSTTLKAQQWEGWGSALKPAHEPIVVARKPLIGTIVENVLEHGTGGLNIDGCRIETEEKLNGGAYSGGQRSDGDWKENSGFKNDKLESFEQPKGRFPANLIHDGSDEVVSLFPESKSNTRPPTGKGILDPNKGWNNNSMIDKTQRGFKDEGSAARFFYCAKASKEERNAGCEGLEAKVKYSDFGFNHRVENNIKTNKRTNEEAASTLNNHPTVKPVALMKYLCRLVTPPNGVVLDLFMGSGTTGIAATQEGFNFVGIEMNDEYIKIANHRISHWVDEKQELILEQRRQKTLFQEW